MRTDIHRPASEAFNPEAYDCHGVFDNHELWGNAAARGQAIRSLVNQGYRFGHGSSDMCGHCGARMRYAALMVHREVKEFIFVGETCLDNRFQLAKGEFARLRKAGKLNSQRATRAEVAERTFEENPWLNEIVEHELTDGFLASLHEQAREGKILSARQIEAGQAALVKAIQRKAERAIEDANAVPAPEGKVTVRGEVKSKKWQESEFGGQLKMLVLADEGFKVWSTVPASLLGTSVLVDGDWIETLDVNVGERVEFTATLTRSSNDETFAIAKRPTKAINLSRA
jgi:hypothetical protein